MLHISCSMWTTCSVVGSLEFEEWEIVYDELPGGVFIHSQELPLHFKEHHAVRFTGELP